MSLQRIEAIARENYLDARHGRRHLMLGLDVHEALKARAVRGAAQPYGAERDGLAELLAVPLIVADEDTLRADAWQLRENAGRAVVEEGSIGTDPECKHRPQSVYPVEGRFDVRCIACNASWTVLP
jgi:hypothetical protein